MTKPTRNPLEVDILSTGILRQKSHKKRKSRDNDDDGDNHVASKQARIVLGLSRELIQEASDSARPKGTGNAPVDTFSLESRFATHIRDVDTQEDDDDEQENDEEWLGFGSDDAEAEGEEEQHNGVDLHDREILAKLFPPAEDDDDLLKHGLGGRPQNATEPSEHGGTRNLGDIILQKIQEAEACHRFAKPEPDGGPRGVDEMQEPLDDRIVDAMEKLGIFLSRYKSGKVPKLFNILPVSPRWEEMIEITKPEEWTPHSVERATRLFVSVNNAVSAVFFETILLPRFRDEIRENGRVNVHVYQAVEKALYRADSFFIGFLFPLVAEGTCTIKEAKVLSAILKQNKIPLLSGCAAIQKLCEFSAEEASISGELWGATNMLIKALIEKEYSMPYKAVDSLVFHLLRTRSLDPAALKPSDPKEILDSAPMRAKLPLIWHETFQSFAILYKHAITEDQREALLDLLQTHGHPKFTPTIRKELLAGRGRGIPEGPVETPFDGDDTMMIDGVLVK